MRGALVILIAVACGHASPPPEPAVTPRDARVATEPPRAPGAPVDAQLEVAGDPPEPQPPAAECNFARVVHCEPGSPTLSAYQPGPFESCPKTKPRNPPDRVFHDAVSQFSARETRAARARTTDACCYVDFVTRQCR